MLLAQGEYHCIPCEDEKEDRRIEKHEG